MGSATEYNTAGRLRPGHRVDSPEGLCYKPCVMRSEPSRPQAAAVPHEQVIGVTGIPEVKPGERLGETIAAAAEKQGTPIESGDILVIGQKVVSKAEGRLIDLGDVEPSRFAREFAQASGRDARLVELVLRESRAIVRMDPARGIIITETRHGFVCANAGIDTSNIPGHDVVSLLPENPDESAERIREQIEASRPGVSVAVIISDTFGRAWREGQANIAIGVAGMNPFKDYRGAPDTCGRILKATNIAVADELASAAELVTAKVSNIPAAIVRGYPFSTERATGARTLLRDRARDLFR